MAKFIDFYSFYPLKIKKDRNFSEELYYVLTSNKTGSAGGNYQTDQDKKGIGYLLDHLWIRLEEKFSKIAQAFNYLDISKNGRISYNELTLGIENLNIKFTSIEINTIFTYLDSNQKGYVTYSDLCKLCEETRREIDPFQC